MGQHKYNQTAILAKEGKLPPKEEKRKVNIRTVEEILFERGTMTNKLQDVLTVASFLKHKHY